MTQAHTTAVTVDPFENVIDGQLVTTAGEFRIVATPEEYERAAELRLKLVEQQRSIEKTRVNLKEPVLEAARRIDAQAKTAAHPINIAIAAIDRLMGDYRRAAEQKRLQAIQREQKRQQDLIDKARAKAEAERKPFVPEDLPPPREIVSTVPKVEGLSIAVLYRAEVVNKGQLALAVARGVLEASNTKEGQKIIALLAKHFGITASASLALMEPQQAALNRIATTDKTDMHIPGVVCRKQDSTRQRG